MIGSLPKFLTATAIENSSSIVLKFITCIAYHGNGTIVGCYNKIGNTLFGKNITLYSIKFGVGLSPLTA